MSVIKQGVQTCPHCGIWEIQAEDAFCGWCRQAVGKLRLKIEPSSVFLAGEGGAQTTQLVIENPTCGTAEIASVFAVPSGWVRVDHDGIFQLGPGETQIRELVVDTLSLESESEVDVVVANSWNDARVSVSAIASLAKPQLDPDTLAFWRNDPDSAAPYCLQIKLAGPRSILSVRSTRSDLIKFDELDNAILVKPLRELEVQAQIDSERLFRQVRRPPTDVQVDVLIEYEGVDGPTSEKASLTLRALNPPELDCYPTSDSGTEFFKPGIAEFEILFRNRKRAGDLRDGLDNAPLRILALDILPSGDGNLSWVQPLTEPIEVAGGGEPRTVTMRLDMEPFFVDEVNIIDVSIRTNRADLDRTLKVEFIVRAIQEFPGILAIDFGTSNTCCYALENGREWKAVQIDESATTSPTFLRYETIHDKTIHGDFADVKIGQKVKRASMDSGSNALATVSRLKQRLGNRKPIYVKPLNAKKGTQREVRMAVVDYLREIRKVAEKNGHSYFRNFVITHPAVCSLRQYRNLLYAVRQAFGPGEPIPFLQEPIASIIPLVRRRAMGPFPREPYFVAAFDFGGGTTDVTVAQIDQKRDADGNQLSLRVVSSWGERWGGEDLTDFLVERLLDRCKQIAPEWSVLIGDKKRRQEEDERLNELRMREWAEEWKINSSNGESYSNTLSLVVRRQDGLSDSFLPASSDLEKPDGSGKTLREEYNAELELRILRLADRLKADLHKRSIDLDVLQLSGKSSAIPQVKEILANQLNEDCEIVTPKKDELKECVVMGACLWHQLKNSSSLSLSLPESLRTTSRLGRLDNGVFFEILPLCWPIGTLGDTPFKGYRWRADDEMIVLHENLGERTDGEDTQPLGSFRPVDQSIVGKELRLTLNLLVNEDYWPTLIATTSTNEQIQFELTDQER